MRLLNSQAVKFPSKMSCIALWNIDVYCYKFEHISWLLKELLEYRSPYTTYYTSQLTPFPGFQTLAW